MTDFDLDIEVKVKLYPRAVPENDLEQWRWDHLEKMAEYEAKKLNLHFKKYLEDKLSEYQVKEQ